MKPKSCIILFFVLVSIAISSISVHSSDNDKPQTYLVYIIKAGDSLSKIAYEYYIDSSQTARIAEFNDIKDIDKLKIGQEIKIPVLLLEKAKKSSGIIVEDLDKPKQGESEKITTEGQPDSQVANGGDSEVE